MSDSYLLTDQERERFMIWCQQQSDTAKQITELMEKANMLETIVEREKMRVLCYGFVADEMSKTESFTVGK